MIDIAVVGTLGFGRGFINEVVKNGTEHDCKLAAIVDVSERAKDEYSDLIENGAKYFNSLEAMYSDMNIDLVLIASPIQYHSQQACYCMEHGSHVLLEKPLAGTIDEAMKMVEARDKTDKYIQVGYQQCFDSTVRKIKSIILSGEYGALQSMKCMVLSPRDFGYYGRNNWAGKKLDKGGRPVYDSISNNAMAHFYMTLMFLAGSDMASVSPIASMDTKLYRANDIETFDTCITKANLESGSDIFVLVSHATKDECGVSLEIKLEGATITINDKKWVLVTDDSENVLGSAEYDPFVKVWDMVRLINDPSYETQCTLENALEHTKFIEMLKSVEVEEFKEKLVLPDRIYVEGLQERLQKAYAANEFPNI